MWSPQSRGCYPVWAWQPIANTHPPPIRSTCSCRWGTSIDGDSPSTSYETCSQVRSIGGADTTNPAQVFPSTESQRSSSNSRSSSAPTPPHLNTSPCTAGLSPSIEAQKCNIPRIGGCPIADAQLSTTAPRTRPRSRPTPTAHGSSVSTLQLAHPLGARLHC
jgi:hypothetical protein